jgi:hypothetical protein
LRDLPLDAGTHFRKGKTKFPMTNPANRGIHGERMFILRIDPTLERSSNGDSHVTRDPAAARREVSELTLTAHQPNLGEKLAEQLDGHTTMPAFIGLSFLS